MLMSTSKRGSYTNISEDPSSLRFPRRDGVRKEALYATVLTLKEESGEDDHKDYWIDWYELDLKKGVISRSLPTMPPSSARQHGAPSVVCCNKTFFLGGSPSKGSDHVFYFDYDRPYQGWKEGPPLLSERSDHSAVALDTRIYVFGGTSSWSGHPHPHAEFFDIDENRWRPLPLPSSNYIADPVLLDSPRRRILVYFESSDGNNSDDGNSNTHGNNNNSSSSSSSLYAYNVDDHSWHCLKDNFDDDVRFYSMSGFWWSTGKVAIVGDIFYWVTETFDYHYDEFLGFSRDREKCCLRAYDLAENKHLTVHWLPSFELKVYYTHAQLYHLGGRDLCLAYYGCEGFEYMKVRVFRDKDSGEVYAHTKSDSLTSLAVGDGWSNVNLSSL